MQSMYSIEKTTYQSRSKWSGKKKNKMDVLTSFIAERERKGEEKAWSAHHDQ